MGPAGTLPLGGAADSGHDWSDTQLCFKLVSPEQTRPRRFPMWSPTQVLSREPWPPAGVNAQGAQLVPARSSPRIRRAEHRGVGRTVSPSVLLHGSPSGRQTADRISQVGAHKLGTMHQHLVQGNDVTGGGNGEATKSTPSQQRPPLSPGTGAVPRHSRLLRL